VGISKRVSSCGKDGGGTAEGGGDGSGAIAGVGAFGWKCGSAGFGFMSEGLRKIHGGDRFKVIDGSPVGESLENRCAGQMARAERTGSSGRLAKGLLESVSEALLRADFRTVESPGTASVCGVEYPKRSTDFNRCRPGRISGSKLLFEMVSKADWSRSNEVA
jgi:hypothetical protein